MLARFFYLLCAWLACLALALAAGGCGEVRADDGNQPDSGRMTADGAPPTDGGRADGAIADAQVPPDAPGPCAACDPVAFCNPTDEPRCACPAGMTDLDGDGSRCSRACTNLALYVDGSPEMEAAARALGVNVFTTNSDDPDGLARLLAQNDIEVVIFDSSLNRIPAETSVALSAWLTAGGRAIVAYWDLDAELELQALLGVSAATYDGWRNVHPSAASPIDLFTTPERVPVPITGEDTLVDNGDELSLTREGVIAARLDSADGPGAIAITNRGLTIVDGFMSSDVGTSDDDEDGKPDMREMWTNQLGFLCE